jgi:predicted enzyme related to lactoylglutathione lyase
MSPTKRTTKAKRVAPKTRRASKPAAPSKWSAEIRDVNVVWYNVSDLGRAKKFYGETLGLPVAMVSEEAGWAEYGYPHQSHLAVNLWRGPDPMPPTLGGATATLTCDDVRGSIERLRAKGVRCEDVEEISGMVILAGFLDPDGNRLQLAQSLSS